MPLLFQLHSIKCLNETSEASDSDEVYALVTVANLRRPGPGIPAPPNFQVFSYRIFEDMDDDDDDPVIVAAQHSERGTDGGCAEHDADQLVHADR